MTSNEQLGLAFKWLGKKYFGTYFEDASIPRIKEEIRIRLFEDVNDVLRAASQTNFPIDVKAIAAIRNADVQFTELTSCKSLLLPKKGGFVIKVDKLLPIFKMRVAIAHEIGHTFFYDTSLNTPQRVYGSKDADYWIEHGIAFEIAREILLPKAMIGDLIAKTFLVPSIESIADLSKKCEVSYDILRLRLVSDLNLWDCTIFRSKIEKDNIKTLKRDISKGESFGGLRIPQVIGPNSKGYERLYEVLSNNSQNKLVETEIPIKSAKYLLNSVFMQPTSCFTILKKAG